jgi:hypothetical protein
MHKKRSLKKTQKKRLVKRIMRGCAQKRTRQNGGNLDTPTFQVGISKFYPMNELNTDVQRNITTDRGPIVGGKKSRRRYSRKYLDPTHKAMRGGYLQGLTPLDYKQSLTSSNTAVQPIIQKFTDTNPYLV